MVDKEYEICKEVCKKEGCYCPEDYKFHITVANTPQFIRAYYYAKGRLSKKWSCYTKMTTEEDKIIEVIKQKVNKATPKELEEALEIIDNKLKEIKNWKWKHIILQEFS